MSIEQRPMIVYPVAAFTSGLNVFKRDGRLWKTINVRAGQEMLWTKKLCVNSSKKDEIMAEIHAIGIRNIRSVDLSYFDRKFGVHKGLFAHFKTTRKRPQNFWLFDRIFIVEICLQLTAFILVNINYIFKVCKISRSPKHFTNISFYS